MYKIWALIWGLFLCLVSLTRPPGAVGAPGGTQLLKESHLSHFSSIGRGVKSPQGPLPRRWALEFEAASSHTPEELRVLLGSLKNFHALNLSWGAAVEHDLNLAPRGGASFVVEPLVPLDCGPQRVWQNPSGLSFWSRPHRRLLGPGALSWPHRCQAPVEGMGEDPLPPRWALWVLTEGQPLPPGADPVSIQRPLGKSPLGGICLGAACPRIAHGSGPLEALPLALIAGEPGGKTYTIEISAVRDVEMVDLLRRAFGLWEKEMGAPLDFQIDRVRPVVQTPVVVGRHGVPATLSLDGSVSPKGVAFGVELKMGYLEPRDVTAASQMLEALSGLEGVWVEPGPAVHAAGLHIHVDIPEWRSSEEESWVPHLPRLWGQIFEPFLQKTYPLNHKRARYVASQALYDSISICLTPPSTWDQSMTFLGGFSSEEKKMLRLCGVNPLSLVDHGTLEVRWFQAAWADPFEPWLLERLEAAYAIVGVLTASTDLELPLPPPLTTKREVCKRVLGEVFPWLGWGVGG